MDIEAFSCLVLVVWWSCNFQSTDERWKIYMKDLLQKLELDFVNSTIGGTSKGDSKFNTEWWLSRHRKHQLSPKSCPCPKLSINGLLLARRSQRRTGLWSPTRQTLGFLYSSFVRKTLWVYDLWGGNVMYWPWTLSIEKEAFWDLWLVGFWCCAFGSNIKISIMDLEVYDLLVDDVLFWTQILFISYVTCPVVDLGMVE